MSTIQHPMSGPVKNRARKEEIIDHIWSELSLRALFELRHGFIDMAGDGVAEIVANYECEFDGGDFDVFVQMMHQTFAEALEEIYLEAVTKLASTGADFKEDFANWLPDKAEPVQ